MVYRKKISLLSASLLVAQLGFCAVVFAQDGAPGKSDEDILAEIAAGAKMQPSVNIAPSPIPIPSNVPYTPFDLDKKQTERAFMALKFERDGNSVVMKGKVLKSCLTPEFSIESEEHGRTSDAPNIAGFMIHDPSQTVYKCMDNARKRGLRCADPRKFGAQYDCQEFSSELTIDPELSYRTAIITMDDNEKRSYEYVGLDFKGEREIRDEERAAADRDYRERVELNKSVFAACVKDPDGLDKAREALQNLREIGVRVGEDYKRDEEKITKAEYENMYNQAETCDKSNSELSELSKQAKRFAYDHKDYKDKVQKDLMPSIAYCAIKPDRSDSVGEADYSLARGILKDAQKGANPKTRKQLKEQSMQLDMSEVTNLAKQGSTGSEALMRKLPSVQRGLFQAQAEACQSVSSIESQASCVRAAQTAQMFGQNVMQQAQMSAMQEQQRQAQMWNLFNPNYGAANMGGMPQPYGQMGGQMNPYAMQGINGIQIPSFGNPYSPQMGQPNPFSPMGQPMGQFGNQFAGGPSMYGQMSGQYGVPQFGQPQFGAPMYSPQFGAPNFGGGNFNRF